MSRVAVICLCYNQANYVQKALESVIAQTYHDWELIIVDDASTDNSLWEIEQFKLAHAQLPIKTIFLGTNIGNCRAFNQALFSTDAKYVIDLAADDMLLPDRVAQGVKNLDLHPEVAINFTNASFIDKEGEVYATHYPIGPLNKAAVNVPEGFVFEEIIARYFICPPTTMIRTAALKAIGGYDENLAYEDFDMLVRLSEQHKFSYTDKILVQKRTLNSSMSSKQYKFGNRQLASTLSICYKILNLLKTTAQKKALLKRVAFESKQAIVNGRIGLFFGFLRLGIKTLLK
jgi:glycosyltransferase involved in cell wall biosynthesis